jgi:hypothetical protein
MTSFCLKPISRGNVSTLRFVSNIGKLDAFALALPKRGRPLSVNANTKMTANPKSNLIFVFEAITKLHLFLVQSFVLHLAISLS